MGLNEMKKISPVMRIDILELFLQYFIYKDEV